MTSGSEAASNSVSKSPSHVWPDGQAGVWPNSLRPYSYSGRSILYGPNGSMSIPSRP